MALRNGRQTPNVFWEFMVLIVLILSVPSTSLGEPVSEDLVDQKNTTTTILPQVIKKKFKVFPPGSGGIRAAESEEEHSSSHRVLQQQTLNPETLGLEETTDASGGTMINLRGQFQCGLKVSQESMETSVEDPVAFVEP